MRILLDLEALNDQKVLDASEYHKVQGFVYDKLISNTAINRSEQPINPTSPQYIGILRHSDPRMLILYRGVFRFFLLLYIAILTVVRVGWSSKPYKQTVPDVHDALHG